MQRVLTVCFLVLVLAFAASAQNISGPLSGTLGPGTFTAVDSIYVASGQSLVIAAGTTIEFAGAFSFRLLGHLNAAGTATDSIQFVPALGVPFWKGIKFHDSAADSSRLDYCVIRGSSTMGVYMDHVSMNVTHCTFQENASVDYGGGVYNYYSGTTYDHCVFINNTAVHGGAMCLRYTPPATVTNCVFSNNNGTYGGAIAIYFSAVTMTNSLFYNNSGNQGGGIRLSSATSTVLTNCTFSGNTASAGWALFNINQIPTLKNLVVYDNVGDSTKAVHVHAGGFTVSFSCIQDSVVWPGAGNFNSNPLFVTGPGGNFYLSQTAAGQAQQSPCVDAGDPAAAMITGATRTDEVQDAGVVDMGYHYAAGGAPPAPVTITLTPLNPPLQIPAAGGSFSYDANLINTTPTAQDFDVWVMVQLPGGPWYGPALGPLALTLPGSANLTRTRIQNVPAGAPSGDYLYEGRVGGYPGTVWSDDAFAFTKLTTGDGDLVSDWACTGEAFPGETLVDMPVHFGLSARPNPFNPVTCLSFNLPQGAKVSLQIFDVSGRRVAHLVDGWRDAGSHQAAFDGSGLASGVYLYRLTAERYSAQGKIMLLK
ncbi:MAG: T9SS C-terminal target domain-containing protein [Candidatus Zixiibacteriota bacterium]|nr:MAG: T9SS C-terminal target domain-containing protein [candidate division Zixibacteria bacterium]